MNTALISIKPKYVKRILDGTKTAELRTRSVNLIEGTKLWIYSTTPEASISAHVVVQSVITDTPDEIWDRYNARIAISEDEFWSYSEGRAVMTVILFDSPKYLINPIDLNTLRSKLGSFMPPQFFSYLRAESEIHNLLSQQLALAKPD